MNSIFLSHSSIDKDFVRSLKSNLEKEGIDVWLDEAELEVGDSLVEKIAKAIFKVKYVAVVLSPSSVKSDWFRKELSLAMSLEIEGEAVKVIPILYKPCEIPIILRDKIYADFTKPEQYESSLLCLIRKIKEVFEGTDKSPSEYESVIKHKEILSKFEIIQADIFRTGTSNIHKVVDKTSGSFKFLKQIKKALLLESFNFSNLNIRADKLILPLEKYEDDLYYYEITDVIDGWTLEEIIILNNGNIFGELLSAWTKELLKLLIPLHKTNPCLVHRDFRPSNILVKKDNLQLVLIDFSNMVPCDLKQKYLPIGSSGFVPPEILEGRVYPSSDLYGCGCTIYRMNSGKFPPTLTQIEHFRKSMSLNDAEELVENIFYKLVALNHFERFENAEKALKSMVRTSGNTLKYKCFQDFHLPDGRTIKQHGWF